MATSQTTRDIMAAAKIKANAEHDAAVAADARNATAPPFQPAPATPIIPASVSSTSSTNPAVPVLDVAASQAARQARATAISGAVPGTTGLPNTSPSGTSQQSVSANPVMPVVPPVQRDTDAEKKITDKYGAPQNTAELKNYLGMAYTPTELAKQVAAGNVNGSMYNQKELADMGLTPERIQQLAGQATDPAAKQRLLSLVQNLQDIGAQGDQAQQIVNANPAPTNTSMNVLKEALNAKNNFQQQPLGESDLFKMAGLGGQYANLQQSMGQRNAEMKDLSNSANNALSMTDTKMVDAFNAATKQHDFLQAQYDKQLGILQDIDSKAQDREAQMKQIAAQGEQNRLTQAADAKARAPQQAIENAIEVAKLQASLPSGITIPNPLDPTKTITGAKTTSKWLPKDAWGNQDEVDGNGMVIATLDGSTGKVTQHGTPQDGQEFASTRDLANTTKISTQQQTDMGAPQGTVLVQNADGSSTAVPSTVLDKIFKIGDVTGQCGTSSSAVSTAGPVGDTWAEKKTHIQATGSDILSGSYAPKAGDKLLIPLAVKSDKDYGHVFTVLSFDPSKDIVYGVEANKRLDGVMHAGAYNIAQLQSSYGDNFGIEKGNLKNGIMDQINKYGKALTSQIQPKNWLQQGVQGGANALLDVANPNVKTKDVTGQVQGMEQKYMGMSNPDLKSLPPPPPAPKIPTVQSVAQDSTIALQQYMVPSSVLGSATMNAYLKGTTDSTKGGARTLAQINAIQSTFQQAGVDFDLNTYDSNQTNLNSMRANQTTTLQSAQIMEQNLTAQMKAFGKARSALPAELKNNPSVINDLMQKGASNLNSPEENAYITAYANVVDPYSKILSGASTGNPAATSPDYMDQAKSALNPGFDDKALEAQLEQIQKGAADKIASIKDGSYMGAALNQVSQKNPLIGIPFNMRAGFITAHPDLFNIPQPGSVEHDVSQYQQTTSPAAGQIETSDQDLWNSLQ